MNLSLFIHSLVVPRLGRLALGIGGVGLGLIVVEILFRQIYPFASPDLYVAHSDVGLITRPNLDFEWTTTEYRIHFQTNADGFREAGTSPSPADYVVAGLGDSFVQGIGVQAEAIFLSRLETVWRARGVQTQVMNFGVTGSGTLHQLKILEYFALQHEPDLILLNFYVNDMSQNLPEPAESEIEPQSSASEANHSSIASRLKQLLATESRSYQVVAYGVKESYFLREWLLRVGVLTSPTETVSEIDFFKRHYESDQELHWQATQDAIRQINSIAEDKGIPMVIILIPSQYQVDARLWEAIARAKSLPADDYELDKPQRLLGKFLAAEGIPFIDLLPLFRDVSNNGRRLYFVEDVHWNDEGHELAAQLIATELDRLDVLP